MESEKLFINKRYVKDLEGKYTIYMSRNGILKKVVNNPLFKRVLTEDNTWYDLHELPINLQESLHNMAITASELAKYLNKGENKNKIIDSEDVTIFVKEDTLILPVVGNILPSDGTHAYTVIFKDGVPSLKPIIICWNCHWSELFTGLTPYGNNVFCLVSELSNEQRKRFLDEIISLKEAAEFLESKEISSKRI